MLFTYCLGWNRVQDPNNKNQSDPQNDKPIFGYLQALKSLETHTQKPLSVPQDAPQFLHVKCPKLIGWYL